MLCCMLYLVAQLCPTLCMSDYLQPHRLQPARLLCPWGFSRQEYLSGLPCTLPGDLFNPGIQPRSPTLQVDSLPSEPPGKPKKTGVGSLFLLQGNFPTQELNQGLLHCRWSLYQLRYQGSPAVGLSIPKNINTYAVFHQPWTSSAFLNMYPRWFLFLTPSHHFHL